jgi:predicted amidohydrolase
MKEPLSLAVIQMVSQAEVSANLVVARRLLEQAAERGARLAVLPENFACMGHPDLASLARAEHAGHGPILPWLRQTARDLGLWVVAGTLPLPPDDRPGDKPRLVHCWSMTAANGWPVTTNCTCSMSMWSIIVDAIVSRMTMPPVIR